MKTWAEVLTVMLTIVGGLVALFGASIIRDAYVAGLETDFGWQLAKAGAVTMGWAIAIFGFGAIIGLLKQILERLSDRPLS